MNERNEIVLNLLKEVNVPCHDDGKCFIKTASPRIDVIKQKLTTTDYLCTEGPLFLLYHKKPLTEYKDNTILVSTHIDCEEDITKCFSKVLNETELLGTYDNSITNTAVLQLMPSCRRRNAL